MTETPLSFLLIGITVLISWKAFEDATLRAKSLFYPYQIKRSNEYHRFLSSGFIHGGWVHLIFNMMTFYFFAPSLEQHYVATYGMLGYLHFALIYLGGIIISSIPSYMKHKDSPHYRALGASGGVAAVLFNFILLDPLRGVCLYFIFCIPGFIMAILYVIYSYVYDKENVSDGIGHSAHLWGSLYGFGIGVAINPMTLVYFFDTLSEWTMF